MTVGSMEENKIQVNATSTDIIPTGVSFPKRAISHFSLKYNVLDIY